MNIDFLAYFQKLGLKVVLNPTNKDKVNNFFSQVLKDFELLQPEKLILNKDNELYYLEVNNKQVNIYPSKKNSVLKSWQIIFPNIGKKEAIFFQVNYIENQKTLGTKYLNAIFELNKDLKIRTSLAYFDNENEDNLTNQTVEKIKHQHVLRKNLLTDYLKLKKPKNNDNLTDFIKIREQSNLKPDLFLTINCIYDNYQNLTTDFINLECSNKYNEKLLTNYIKNNLNKNITQEYDVFNNYLQILNEGIDPYLNQKKITRKNKCA